MANRISNTYKKELDEEDKTRKELIKQCLLTGPKQRKELLQFLKVHGKPVKSITSLVKHLTQLIKQGDVIRTISPGKSYPVYQFTSKSKVLAEFCGIGFRNLVRGNFIVTDGLDVELGITKKENINADVLMRFFGFYVLYSIIVSRTLPKNQRSDWLKSVLDLEKSLPMSKFFEVFVDKNEETVKKITLELRENYKKNFGYMSKIFLDTTYNLKIKLSKEIMEFVEKSNK